MFNTIALASDQKRLFLIDDQQLHTFSLESGNGAIIGLLSRQLTVASPSDRNNQDISTPLELNLNIHTHQTQLIYLPTEQSLVISSIAKNTSIFSVDMAVPRGGVGTDDVDPTLAIARGGVGTDDVDPTLAVARGGVGTDDVDPTLARGLDSTTGSKPSLLEGGVGTDDVDPTLLKGGVGTDDVDPTLTGSTTIQNQTRINLQTHNLVIVVQDNMMKISVVAK